MSSQGISLSAVQREALGGAAAGLRRRGFVPAVLYGHGVENLELAIDAKVFSRLLPQISSSTLLTLTIGQIGTVKDSSQGDERRVLIQEVQRDPLTGRPTHVDFHQVKLTEKIRAHVPLRPTGVASAVKDRGGVLIQSLSEIDVEALPENLPSEILVDLAKLITFEDRITVADLSVPGTVVVHTKPEDVVAVVIPPRTEEELKELETAAETKVAEVKTEGEEKKVLEEAKKAGEGAEGAPLRPGSAGQEKTSEGKKEEKEEKEEKKEGKKGK